MKTLSNNNILALTNMKYAINNGIFRHPKIENPVINFYEIDNHIYYTVNKNIGILYNENIVNNWDFFGYFENKKVIARVKKKLKSATMRSDILELYNKLENKLVFGGFKGWKNTQNI